MRSWRSPCGAISAALIVLSGVISGWAGMAAPVVRASGILPVSSPSQLTRLVAIQGSVLPALSSAHRGAPLVGSRSLAVALSLNVRNRPGLGALLRQLYDPRSPQYHHFLTPGQFAARFAPTVEQRAQLVRWLTAHDVHVVHQSTNGLEIVACGSLAHIEAAFHTHVFQYRMGQQRFFANATAVQLPHGMASEITAVSGLTSGGREAPAGLRQAARAEDGTGQQGYYSPQDLQKLYGVSPLYSAGTTGAGQTVALVEFSDFKATNLAAFDSQYGLTPAPDVRVQVNDGTGAHAQLDSNEAECELDIEVVQAIAPQARQLVYEAANGLGDITDVAMYNQIISEDRAQVISTSWDKWEGAVPHDALSALNILFEEAAAQGQSLLAASGDSGPYGEYPETNKKVASVRFPSADPFVTGVGGTSLNRNSDGSYGGESAWWDTGTSSPEGGGGGLSTLFKRPSWQAGPGVNNQSSNGMRQVPDVSANAVGYSVYTTMGSQTGWNGLDGTSAATPLWAGFISLVNQSLGSPIGFLNPTLYALGQHASSFAQTPYHDVTRGSNPVFSTTPGWDYPTGWGSFDAPAFLSDVQQLGVIVARPVDLTLRAEVARHTTGHFKALKSVKRGKSVELAIVVDVNAVPDNSNGVWTLQLSGPRGSIYQNQFSDHFGRADYGRVYVRFTPYTVPKSAAKGAYTFTAQLAIDGVTESSTAHVRLK